MINVFLFTVLFGDVTVIADRTGQTDATSQILSAVAFSVPGDRIVFPAGTYLTTGIHLVGLADREIIGSGLVTIRLADGSESHTVNLEDCQRVTLRNLIIDGNKAGNSLALHGVRLARCDEITIENLAVLDAAWYGVGLQKWNTRCRMLNSSVRRSRADGIDIKNEGDLTHSILIHGVEVADHGDGAGMDLRGNRIVISDCRLVVDAALRGIRVRELSTANGAGAIGAQILGCRIEGGAEAVNINAANVSVVDAELIGDGAGSGVIFTPLATGGTVRGGSIRGYAIGVNVQGAVRLDLFGVEIDAAAFGLWTSAPLVAVYGGQIVAPTGVYVKSGSAVRGFGMGITATVIYSGPGAFSNF